MGSEMCIRDRNRAAEIRNPVITGGSLIGKIGLQWRDRARGIIGREGPSDAQLLFSLFVLVGILLVLIFFYFVACGSGFKKPTFVCLQVGSLVPLFAHSEKILSFMNCFDRFCTSGTSLICKSSVASLAWVSVFSLPSCPIRAFIHTSVTYVHFVHSQQGC